MHSGDREERGAMGDNRAKGLDFEKKAEKKLNGWAFFGSKYEDAADLFDKAGNSYKLAKACERRSPFPSLSFQSLPPLSSLADGFLLSRAGDEAANVYIKLADCHLKVRMSM